MAAEIIHISVFWKENLSEENIWRSGNHLSQSFNMPSDFFPNIER